MHLGVVGNGKTEYDSLVYGRGVVAIPRNIIGLMEPLGLDFEILVNCLSSLLWLRQRKKVINIVIMPPQSYGKKV